MSGWTRPKARPAHPWLRGPHPRPWAAAGREQTARDRHPSPPAPLAEMAKRPTPTQSPRSPLPGYRCPPCPWRHVPPVPPARPGRELPAPQDLARGPVPRAPLPVPADPSRPGRPLAQRVRRPGRPQPPHRRAAVRRALVRPDGPAHLGAPGRRRTPYQDAMRRQGARRPDGTGGLPPPPCRPRRGRRAPPPRTLPSHAGPAAAARPRRRALAGATRRPGPPRRPRLPCAAPSLARPAQGPGAFSAGRRRVACLPARRARRRRGSDHQPPRRPLPTQRCGAARQDSAAAAPSAWPGRTRSPQSTALDVPRGPRPHPRGPPRAPAAPLRPWRPPATAHSREQGRGVQGARSETDGPASPPTGSGRCAPRHRPAPQRGWRRAPAAAHRPSLAVPLYRRGRPAPRRHPGTGRHGSPSPPWRLPRGADAPGPGREHV